MLTAQTCLSALRQRSCSSFNCCIILLHHQPGAKWIFQACVRVEFGFQWASTAWGLQPRLENCSSCTATGSAAHTHEECEAAQAGASTSGATGKASKGGVNGAPEPYFCPCCAIADKHVVLKKGHKCVHKSKLVAGALGINSTCHGISSKLYVKKMTKSGVAFKVHGGQRCLTKWHSVK